MVRDSKEKKLSYSLIERIKSLFDTTKDSLVRFFHKIKNLIFETGTDEQLHLKYRESRKKDKDYYGEEHCKSCKRQVYKYRMFEADRI